MVDDLVGFCYKIVAPENFIKFICKVSVVTWLISKQNLLKNHMFNGVKMYNN